VAQDAEGKGGETIKYPPTIFAPISLGPGKTGKALFKFDMVAPITGDAVYKYEDEKTGIHHALLPNPDAYAHQLQTLRDRV
jgi:hypothetical protein